MAAGLSTFGHRRRLTRRRPPASREWRRALELRAIQQAVGTTFVYVTHDQEEALTMSDRLAVLRDGRLMQVGTPSEVYSRSAHAYVAGFLGTANMYDAVVSGADGGTATCRLDGLTLRVEAGPSAVPGAEVSVVIRPERVEVRAVGAADVGAATGGNLLHGKVE